MTTNSTTATSPPAARLLHEICEAARQVNCGECWALPGDECVYTTVPVSVPITKDAPVRPVRGYHVARLGRAMRRGLISGLELIAVLGELDAFTNATVVWDTEDGASRDSRPDNEPDEHCPTCGAVSWGQTPDGRAECTRCLWPEPTS